MLARLVPESHYQRRHLAAFSEIGSGNPELARLFFGYYGAVFADGALSVRQKALAALAVAHAVQCPYCIDAYTSGALEKGADLEQLTEAVQIAAATRAASTAAYGAQAMEQARWLELAEGADAPAQAYFRRGQAKTPIEAPRLDAWLKSTLLEEGALDSFDKAVIYAACAHGLQCPYSIEAATARALELGAKLDALTEAVHVACAIRGGASLVHGIQMLEQVRTQTM